MVGDYWTKRKLDRIESHLPVFTREMDEQGFRTLYVDAFAGDGTVYFKPPKTRKRGFDLGLQTETSVPGSATRSLRAAPSFDTYLLNDKNRGNCQKLREMRDGFPAVADRVFVKNRDANDFVLKVCEQKDWKKMRAVFLLDPNGTQLRWKTLEAIAKTKAADVWYLFPISTSIRMLAKRGIENESSRETLRKVLGISADEFYRTYVKTGFLGKVEQTTRTINMNGLVRLVVQRFRAIFPFVPWPKMVENRAGSTIFLLFFASCIQDKRETNEFMKKLMAYSFNSPLRKSI